MTDREKLLNVLKTYQLDSMRAILNCYLEVYYKDISATKLYNLIHDLNCCLSHKIEELEATKFVARERATYLKSYLNGDMWLTEEAAKENIQPQIDNAQAIIDACNGR